MELHKVSQFALAFVVASVLAVGSVGSVYAHPTPPEENQGGQEGCASDARHDETRNEVRNNDCGNR